MPSESLSVFSEGGHKVLVSGESLEHKEGLEAWRCNQCKEIRYLAWKIEVCGHAVCQVCLLKNIPDIIGCLSCEGFKLLPDFTVKECDSLKNLSVLCPIQHSELHGRTHLLSLKEVDGHLKEREGTPSTADHANDGVVGANVTINNGQEPVSGDGQDLDSELAELAVSIAPDFDCDDDSF